MGKGWVYLLEEAPHPLPMTCLSSYKGIPVSVPKAGTKASALSVPRRGHLPSKPPD